MSISNPIKQNDADQEIAAIKVPSLTKVPQKILRKLGDRIINANKTISPVCAKTE